MQVAGAASACAVGFAAAAKKLGDLNIYFLASHYGTILRTKLSRPVVNFNSVVFFFFFPLRRRMF